jgi:hypothetical protein
VAEELAEAAGLGAGRVRFVKPPSGLGGPASAVSAFRTGLTPSPLEARHADSETRGVDRALAILAWLKGREELTPALPRSLAEWLGPVTASGETLLDLGDLAELDLLLSLSVPGWRLREALGELRARLAERGIEPKLVTTVRREQAQRASRIVLATGSASARSQGPEVVPAASLLKGAVSENGFRCRLEPSERAKLMEELKTSASSPRCAGLHELAQARLALRRGAWQEAVFGEPRVGFLTTEEAAG